jgi:hypothetical protein
MAADLFTPILNDRTRSVRFFNGRLLSGEAMTDEQSGQRAARALLAQAVGEGIAQGFEIKESVGSSTTLAPVLAVGAGVAINRRGEILLLAADTEVKLVRPAHQAAAPASVFQTCTPPTQGVYVADSGVYLLTVCSLGAANGLAEVSGLGGIQAGCNAKYIVDAVQFRLLELPVDPATLNDARARNLIAYQCFGVDHLLDFATNPFGTAGEPRTLLDDARGTKQLTDCDVPLGLMYWTATGGIQFLDMWSVRRRVTRRTAASQALSDTRIAAAEAMVLQFQEQLAGTVLSEEASMQASARFRYLPPAGFVPVKKGALAGFTVDAFFRDVPHRQPEYVDAAAVTSLMREAVEHPPIDLQSKQAVWLYAAWQNATAAATAYVIFASPYTRYRAAARFDVARWNDSNYSNCSCDA